MTQGIFGRLVLMISRGVLSLIDDKPGAQSVQVKGYDKEVLPDVEHLQPYGFTAVPLPGAEAVVLSPSGMRENGFVILVEDRRFRVKALGPGEVAVYDDKDQVIHLAKDGIHIKTPKDLTATVGGNVIADITGNVTATIGGDVTATVSGGVTASIGGDLVTTVGGSLSATVSGSLSADVSGTASLKASGVTIDSPKTHITGALMVDKQITGAGGLAISGGSGATVSGSLRTTGDVVAAGISLDGHTHSGVEPGKGSTGGPQ